MALSVLDDKSVTPNASILAQAAGDMLPWWTEVRSFAKSACGSIEEKWNFRSKANGWSLRVVSRKRPIVFFMPREDCLRFTFILKDRELDAARGARLPERFYQAMDAAKQFDDGIPVALEISSVDDVAHVKRLIEIKAANLNRK